jgi:hypothetical protein
MLHVQNAPGAKLESKGADIYYYYYIYIYIYIYIYTYMQYIYIYTYMQYAQAQGAVVLSPMAYGTAHLSMSLVPAGI